MIKEEIKRLRKMKSYIELLKTAEREMDIANSVYGDKERLCIFCNSEIYNSKVGIVHNPDCIILNIRGFLKQEKTKEKYPAWIDATIDN